MVELATDVGVVSVVAEETTAGGTVIDKIGTTDSSGCGVLPVF